MFHRIPPSELSALTGHRPSSLPDGRWNFYQEWHDAVFLHYSVDAAILREAVPKDLMLDLFEGKAWISVVAFTMRNVRPRWLPSWSFVSDFHELNLRTYVVGSDGRTGVYFLSIDAAKWVSVLLARLLSVLPYRKAGITRTPDRFEVHTKRNALRLSIVYSPGEPVPAPTTMDRWLVERYALFERCRNRTWCYRIHHLPWPLRTIHIKQALIQPFGSLLPLTLPSRPDLAHFSYGVEILSWPPQRI